uniref:Uncharacterized protein n=1 Tax=Papio anubis TaxID=9555 RepID=A0A8I5NGE7_PAPAN
MCLLVICTYSVEKFLFRSFAYCKNWVVFLLLICKISDYICIYIFFVMKCIAYPNFYVEVLILSTSLNVNHQDNGENIARSSQVLRSRRKKWLHGLGPGSCAVCSLGTWCPASQPLHPSLKGAKVQLMLLLYRVEAPSLGSFHVVLSLRVHRIQELRFGNLHLDFRACMEMHGCSGRSLVQRWGPHGELLLGQCRREIWVWQPPHRVCTGALPSRAVRRGPLSSRHQNARSTNILHCAPGKAADAQHKPMKVARRGAIPCKATGAELPKTWEPTSCISMTWM